MGDWRLAVDRQHYAFYPGCLVLHRFPQYELSTKRLLAELRVSLQDMPEAACCGAPVVESFSGDWVNLAAYNLALAEQMGLDILTVCGSCTNSLKRAQLALRDPALRERINERLAPLELSVAGTGQVRHLLQFLSEQQGRLRKRVTRPLSLKVALTYPCQVSRPGDIAAFDDPLHPRAMHELAALTGAEVVETGVEHDCCGSSYLMADEGIALAAGRRKLRASRVADVLVDACGNCHLLLERMQKAICADRSTDRLPVLFLPQLLGLALGLPPEELGMRGTLAAAHAATGRSHE